MKAFVSIFIPVLAPVLFLLWAFCIPAAEGLWCYQCVSTQPGCGTPFDWRWHTSFTCPDANDKCVKIIERKGAEVVITRKCLSQVEYSRHDVPADKYEGCRSAAKDIQLAHYVNNTIKQLDVARNYYDEVTWCFCQFDHFCNGGRSHMPSWTISTATILLSLLFVF